MNIRLSSDEIRFRISEAEHQALLESRNLSESLCLPDGVELSYSVTVTDSQEGSGDGNRLSVTLRENNLSLNVSERTAKELGNASSKKEGIADRIPINGERSLNCFLQIDIGKRG